MRLAISTTETLTDLKTDLVVANNNMGNLKLIISLSFHAINIGNYMLRHVPIHISYESFKHLTIVYIQENNINDRMLY